MSQSAAASQVQECSSDKIKQIFSEGDCAYRNRIAQGAGLLPEEAYKLNSIAGLDEFVERTSELALNPEIYSPGGKIFNPNGSIKAFDNKNIENLIFGANFHIHTQNSDGALTVEKLLNDSAKYADKYFEKNKKPFFIAITDHDSVQGCIEAVNIIKSDPEKYKNLKLVLGIENTTKIKNSPFLYQDGEAHVLSYCINPFSDDIQNFLIKRVQANKQNVVNVLNNANEKFNGIINQYDFKYDIDDMSHIAPMIKGSVKNASYYIKDYLQFKLIYSFAVSRNKQLLDILKEKGININNIDYSTFIKYIPKNLDYSQGQKYFDYYLTALREYFEKQLSCDKAEINRLIPQIPSSLKSVLQEMENLTLTPNSPLYAPNNEFPLFEDCISALAKFKDGAISMAHPGVLFPYKALKSNEDTVKLYEKLYEIFNLKGKPKKLFSEDFYGSYYNNNESLYKKLHEISEKYSLLKTGGLDTHSTNIFSV